MRHELTGISNDIYPVASQGSEIVNPHSTPPAEMPPVAERVLADPIDPSILGAASVIAYSYSVQELRTPSAKQYVSEVLGQLDKEGLPITLNGLYKVVARFRTPVK